MSMLLCMHNAHISTVYNTAYCMDEKLPHVKHLYIYMRAEHVNIKECS